MTQTNQPTETSARGNRKGVVTHVAKVPRRDWGKKTTYDRIGVLITNDNGSLYLKLNGKQIVESGIYLYKITDKKDLAADEAAVVDDGGADEEAGV